MIEPMHMDVKQLNRDGGRTWTIAEDADAGIEAGKRAGMKTLAVQGAKGADFSAESLEKCDLISLL